MGQLPGPSHGHQPERRPRRNGDVGCTPAVLPRPWHCLSASADASRHRGKAVQRCPIVLRASQGGALRGARRVGIAPNGRLDFSRCRPCQPVARRAARRHPPLRRGRMRPLGLGHRGGCAGDGGAVCRREDVLALAAVRRRRVVAAACSMWPRRLPAAAARQKVARFVQGTDLRRAWLRCRRDSEEETQVSLSQPELSTAGWLSRLRRKRIWVNTRGRLDSSS